ncbi:MAG: hypothetical protein ACE5H3_08260 [Planctomycetota bacterium]
MIPLHDTSRSPEPESRSPRPVFLLEETAPASEAAGTILAVWNQAGLGGAPALVLAQERVYSRLVDRLRERIQALAPAPGEAGLLAEAVRREVDAGATLIAGGQPAAEGFWKPTLIVNLAPAAPLIRDQALRGPILATASFARLLQAEEFLENLAGPRTLRRFPEFPAA